MIAPEQSAAFYEQRGRVLGEQPDDVEGFEDDERIPCACRDHFLYGADAHCPACSGTGFTDVANQWCDACGLYGTCPDCSDGDYDERGDR